MILHNLQKAAGLPHLGFQILHRLGQEALIQVTNLPTRAICLAGMTPMALEEDPQFHPQKPHQKHRRRRLVLT
jgi:hypothetical protein